MRCLYSSKWRKRVLCGRHFGITEDGEKPIEEIQPGDYVWSWGEETGETQLQPVLETYVNETNELVHVFVAGEEIVCTPNHPFYSPVKGWTEACRLRAGDILVTVNGEYVVVEWIQHNLLESPIKVYNFQVCESHTYYASSLSILVHNSCHGNSLDNPSTNYGYELQDSQGNILKYGETIHPETRYSQVWLEENGYTMRIMVTGTKQNVHAWQHQKILDYVYVAGNRPPLNLSLW